MVHTQYCTTEVNEVTKEYPTCWDDLANKNDSFLTKKSSWCFVHLRFFRMNCIEERRSCVCSGEMPAVIWLVSITILKKVSWVDGPSIFQVLIVH